MARLSRCNEESHQAGIVVVTHAQLGACEFAGAGMPIGFLQKGRAATAPLIVFAAIQILSPQPILRLIKNFKAEHNARLLSFAV